MDPLQPGPADAMFTVVPVLVVVLIAIGIGTAIYRAVHLAGKGVNPLTVHDDLAAQVLQSQALQRPRTKAERLDELDALRAMGRIDEAELQAARARILSE